MYALTVLAMVFATATSALAQASGPPTRIGLLVSGPAPGEHPCVVALRRGLVEHGHVEGQTYVFETRWTEHRAPEAFPRFGAELVARRVALIVSVSAEGLEEAKASMASVPVVMALAAYPVERGLVASLSRPGRNMTGLATFNADLYARRFQLLAEVLPGLSRAAVFRVPGAMSDLIVRDFERAARQAGVKLQVLELRGSGPDDIAGAFQEAARARARAVLTTQSSFFYQYRRVIADLALKHKLPTFSGETLAADAGTLITHGARIADNCYRAANFVDEIVHGATPADLPVEQPVKFELVVNLRTARALGISVPAAVVVRADRVID